MTLFVPHPLLPFIPSFHPFTVLSKTSNEALSKASMIQQSLAPISRNLAPALWLIDFDATTARVGRWWAQIHFEGSFKVNACVFSEAPITHSAVANYSWWTEESSGCLRSRWTRAAHWSRAPTKASDSSTAPTEALCLRLCWIVRS